MRERPILFSAPMVRAILAGTKTQTRCVPRSGVTALQCPYGSAGDRLWAREAWRTYASLDHLHPRSIGQGAGVQYECGGTNVPGSVASLLGMGRLRPAMFMPRWASRITLEVLDAHVEHLQEISEADVIEEGIECTADGYWIRYTDDTVCADSRTSYKSLWQSINGNRPGFTWADNPLVWAVTFRVLPTHPEVGE